MSHIFALHVCTVLCATCMLGAHVHVATMPHACQTLMCMLLLCHVHVNLPTIPRYVIDPYQISFTLMLFIPTQTQCTYHRVSYISTVLDFLLTTLHKGNSIHLSCVRSHFLTHTTMAELPTSTRQTCRNTP